VADPTWGQEGLEPPRPPFFSPWEEAQERLEPVGRLKKEIL